MTSKRSSLSLYLKFNFVLRVSRFTFLESDLMQAALQHSKDVEHFLKFREMQLSAVKVVGAWRLTDAWFV